MRSVEIRRIPLWPIAKIGFIVSFIVMFIIMLLYTSLFASLIGSALSMLGGSDVGMPGTIGGFALVVLGIFTAFVMSIIQTLIMLLVVVIYNVIANGMGGIMLELRDWDLPEAVVVSEDELHEPETIPDGEGGDPSEF